MENVIIRAVTRDDLPGLTALWHERMTLQQQTDRRFSLATDAKMRWSAAVEMWMLDAAYHVLVAERNSLLIGYIVGQVQNTPPGLVPEQVGVITEMHIGAHSYHSGLGRSLLSILRDWFLQRGITVLIAQVPRRQPVEQAFWRATGATEWVDMMWMKI